MLHHLKPDEERRLQFRVQIQAEVDQFMKLMWNWLNQQSQQRVRRRDLASVALRQIARVVSPPALVEGPFDTERGSVTPVSEAAPSSLSDESVIPDEADEADEAAPETAAHPVRDELCCILASALLRQVVKSSPVVSPKAVQQAIVALKETLSAELTGSAITSRPSDPLMKRAVKAAYKDLRKELLWTSLLSQEAWIYKRTAETLKRHLLTAEKKTGVNAFVRSVFRTLAKPFSACFK